MFNPETGTFAANKVMRELGKSGQIGSIEPGKVLTFDGDTTEKVTTDLGEMVKVSDEYFDLNTVGSITVNINGTFEQFDKAQFTVDSDGAQAIFLGEFPLVFAAPCDNSELAITKGIYFFVLEDQFYPVKLAFAETIHPIDPKYLPGAVEINLADYGLTLDGLSVDSNTLIIPDENYELSSKLLKAVDDGLDVVVVGTMSIDEVGTSTVYIPMKRTMYIELGPGVPMLALQGLSAFIGASGIEGAVFSISCTPGEVALQYLASIK